MVCAKVQTDGMGSRGNGWESHKGNLFFSFSIAKSELPDDLPLSATSIYFSFLLKMVLQNVGSKVWIKWPNDFYLEDKKIGGTITTVKGEDLVCGIGLNLVSSSENFSHLDIDIEISVLLAEFIKLLEKRVLWKKVLKEFEVEFHRSRKFQTHSKNTKISLEEAILCDDGALSINGQRIYGLR